MHLPLYNLVAIIMIVTSDVFVCYSILLCSMHLLGVVYAMGVNMVLLHLFSNITIIKQIKLLTLTLDNVVHYLLL